MPPAVQVFGRPRTRCNIRTQTLAGPNDFVHVLLRCDVNPALVINGKGIAYPTVARRFCGFSFGTLTVVKPNRVILREVALHRYNVAVLGCRNEPSVIGHAESHDRTRNVLGELKRPLFDNLGSRICRILISVGCNHAAFTTDVISVVAI